MSDIYDAERLQKISEIMPRFRSHAAVGDSIAFGLEGDPLYPYADGNRPTGTIVKVKSTSGQEDAATLRVKMSNGKNVDILPHSVDASRGVWEYTEKSFEDVLKRSIQQNMPSDNTPEYRGSTHDEDSFASLRSQLAKMKSAHEEEMLETRKFNNTLVATLNEMATELTQISPDENGFCKVFTDEYTNMIGDTTAPAYRSSSSPFESDFSDSGSDYSVE